MKGIVSLPFFMVSIIVAEQMKVDNSIPLTIYNHRPSVQLQHKRKLQRLSKVKSDQVVEIALRVCHANKIHSKRLKHKGQLLFYRIVTEKCLVEINALDGDIISKEVYHKKGFKK